MTIKEGQGRVPPTPVKVRIRGSDVRQLMDIANKRNAHRRYSSSSSKWKQGSCKSPILVGLVGEWALQTLLSRRLNQTIAVVDDRLNSGDGGVDLKVFGVKYQIKTSGRVFRSVLVRRIDGRKKLVAHSSDRFIFCAWNDQEKDVQVVGWCTWESLRENGRIERPKVADADWWNIALETKWLESVDSLVRQMKIEREELQDGTH